MVREANAADAAGMAQVQVAAWRAAYRGFLPRQLLDELSESLRASHWEGVVAGSEGGRTTLVAPAEGPLEGFCSVIAPSRDPDAGQRTAEVTATYVDPARWGSGVGRALLGEALRRLREDGCQDVTTWVFLRNAQGRAFYARSGFRLDGETGVHDASGARTTRLRASLAG